jgi:hypothetical protein
LQPCDHTSALQNLDVVAIDQRFYLPDDICVLCAGEEEGGASRFPSFFEGGVAIKESWMRNFFAKRIEGGRSDRNKCMMCSKRLNTD